MFNKKKLEKEVVAYQLEVQASLKDLTKELSNIRVMADAGERYAALAQLEADVSDAKNKLADRFKERVADLSDQVSSLKDSLSVGGITVAICGTFFFSVMAVPVLAFIAFLGGSAATATGMAISRKLSNEPFYAAATKKIEETKQSFAALSAEIECAKEAVLDKELKGVATSARFNELYRRPEVKRAFDAAAVRARAWDEGRANRLDGKKFNP